MNLKQFELSSNQIKVRNILTRKNFLEMEIYAISNADPNRNASCFTIESMEKGINTFTDKPIMGFFNGDDFEQHNGKVAYDSELDCEYWDNSNGEQILGFIRDSDRKEIREKDGLSWIVTTAMVYTKYNYWQIKRLLRDKRKKVSVEVSVLDSEVINGIEYIYDFELIGITILGSKNGIPIQEGIAGANLSILDLQDKLSYANQSKAICFAYEDLDKNKNKNNTNKEEGEKYSLGTPEDYKNTNITNKEESMSEEEICALQKECDDLRMRCKEYEDKCADYEAKVTEYESKCTDYEAKVTDYEAKVTEYEARCAEYENKCTEFDAKFTEYETKCADYEAKCAEYETKYADYEDYKLRCEKAESQLESINQEKMSLYFTDLTNKMKLSAEDVKELKQKYDANGFSSIEDINSAVALICFNKELSKMADGSKSTGHFTAPLSPEGDYGDSNTNKRTGTLSVFERLKLNI